MLLIDPTDATSMYLGNHYKNARDIPDANVFYVNSAAPDYVSFAATSLQAFKGSLSQRGIGDHVDYIVLAPQRSFFVYTPGNLITEPAPQCASVPRIAMTGAYATAQFSPEVVAGISVVDANRFGNNGPYPSGLPATAFSAQESYLAGAPSGSSAARKYYVSALLGSTRDAVGNTVPELLSMIDRSVASDGTRPAGTFYFMNNLADPLRNVRACDVAPCNTPTFFNATASGLNAMGASAQVLNGILPPANTGNILGAVVGAASFDIAAAHLGFVPGAFADHLTSASAMLDCTNAANCQTQVTRWIAAGASGSAGSVWEPCNYARKFTAADFHKYYFSGMSLGESFLRSIGIVPLQVLLYGDPLTRPFARIPTVSVAALPQGAVSGAMTITPSAVVTQPGAAVSRYELLVDGIVQDTVGAGQSFALDTSLLDDGWHDLRVLAHDDSAVRNVGRWVGSLQTSNHGHGAAATVSPASGHLGDVFSFSYTVSASGLREVRLVQNGRVLAASTAATGTLSVFGQNLGAGVSRVKVEAWYADDRLASSVPVSITVASSGSITGPAPVAYSYSKRLAAATATLVELPASHGVAPNQATYTLLTTPTQASLLQPGLAGPYRIVKPLATATGSEQLQFSVTTPGGTSGIATVTLVYSP